MPQIAISSYTHSALDETGRRSSSTHRADFAGTRAGEGVDVVLHLCMVDKGVLVPRPRQRHVEHADPSALASPTPFSRLTAQSSCLARRERPGQGPCRTLGGTPL